MTIARFSFLALAVTATAAVSTAAQAENFFLTYHVERFASTSLGLEACAGAASLAASAAGMQAQSQNVEGQLITVQGGQTDVGSFVVQCIAVGDQTVSVVHGIDYGAAPGPLQAFANAAFEAIKSAAK